MPRYIDADELYDILSLFYDTEIVRKDKVARFIAEQTLFDIKEIPTADVQEVVHGEWMPERAISLKLTAYRCTECRNIYTAMTRYCPACGAKMDGGGAR